MDKYNPQSKYCYEGTNVLINKLGIQDEDKLNQAERILSGRRLAELHLEPLPGNFDLAHLRNIHKFLFQDIYDFAGNPRDEQITKDSTPFAHPLHLIENSNALFKQLKEEAYLLDLDVVQFSDRAAYYMAEINILHPFREGNGRTQREFIRQLALKNGYHLDWDKINGNKLLEASIKSSTTIRT
ncbi:Fic/DOC family protein [Pseudalkalibacillus salsuginis]|uniref:Fic/DOC family protein n=1 Tax=Pseudalkalibacillus salsuginis TaxID=2910972 RepID=UPI001F1C84C7|nr:Fic family protein [Pseudalkalibacillus salsuginis]MCF6409965.1 Fic family protein [Pseudalkalibacillus salsuginis]